MERFVPDCGASSAHCPPPCPSRLPSPFRLPHTPHHTPCITVHSPSRWLRQTQRPTASSRAFISSYNRRTSVCTHTQQFATLTDTQGERFGRPLSLAVSENIHMSPSSQAELQTGVTAAVQFTARAIMRLVRDSLAITAGQLNIIAREKLKRPRATRTKSSSLNTSTPLTPGGEQKYGPTRGEGRERHSSAKHRRRRHLN